MTDPVYLTPKEAAARWRVHVKTVYRWLRAGVLKGSHVGDNGHWHVDGTSMGIPVANSQPKKGSKREHTRASAYITH